METISVVGYVVIDPRSDLPVSAEEFFASLNPPTNEDYRSKSPIVVRRSLSMDIISQEVPRLETLMNQQAFVLTRIVLRHLQEEKVDGNIALWYLIRKNGWDWVIECAAYAVE